MTVGLTLFGAPTIAVGGKSVALQFERRTQLLVYLALKRSWVARAELAALLWPGQSSQLAYTNLRKALHRLQDLPGVARLDIQAGALRLEAHTDVHDFETALREQRIVDALALHHGDLLAGFDDDGNEAWSGWMHFERDRLRSAWRAAAAQHLHGEISATEAVDLAARLLDADPLDESALRLYIEWLVRAGQVARARQAYSMFIARLRSELGLEPGAELRSLQSMFDTAATVAVRAPEDKAIVSDDGFMGRVVELRRIDALMAQDDCRLLCIIGPGGIGKTSLARRAMEQLAPAFADGTAFVSLDDLAAVEELGGRIAHELDIALRGAADPLEQIAAALAARHMLLVLDNFEQLVDGARRLETLLATCPRLKLLVTSRVRLALANEWLLPLDGLACPDDEDQDRLEAFDAARLFIRAAHRVNPDLVAAAEAPAIVDICRQVEGLPLALELAASWTRVMSCEAISAELRQSSELLQASDATRPARHASIETVFEESWRLLTDGERDVLMRLSVFSVSFSLEAARAVVRAPLPVLGALVDKSLLHREAGRLRLHPLVQQLAAERLRDSAVADETRAAHAEYFHRLLERNRRAISHADRAAQREVDLEFENIRRAWQWSISHAKVDLMAYSSTAIVDYCDHRGRSEEGLALLKQALDSPAIQANTQLHTVLLSKASHLEYRLDRYAAAEESAERVLSTARRSSSRGARLQALSVLGTCAFRLGRLTEAQRRFKEALETGSAEDPAELLANTLDHLALIEKALGNYAEASRLALKSLAEYRRLGDGAEEALCLNNLGSLRLLLGEDESAAMHLREGLAICERDGLTSTQAFILTNLTEVAMRSGDLDGAEAYCARAIQAATSTGNRAVAAWARIKSARLALQRGALDGARTRLAESLNSVIAIGVPSLKTDGLICFAQILVAQGEPACARAVATFVLGHALTTAAARKEALARLSSAGLDAEPALEWPGIDIDDLIGRVVLEAGQAYAPLIAVLRGSH